jgi:hypothetical protein
MLAPVAHILPLTTIRRERLLPLPGRITVREGQKVNPMDVVAEARLGKNHVLLNVGRRLEIPPAEAQKLILVKVGDVIPKGELIARQKGFMSQTITAPQSGRVLVVGNGQVLMEVGDSTFELKASLPGVVTRQLDDRGVEITFSGALIQGVWGNGELNVGMMLPMLTSAEGSLALQQLDVSLRGSVLLAGYCDDPGILKTADELPVRGLILGGMSSALVPQALQSHYPIILIDGFYKRPLNSTAFKLLTTNAKRDVTLNAVSWDKQTGARPEIYIPLPVTQPPPSPRDAEAFAPDQSVRLTQEPHSGEVATLVNLKVGLTPMPSGIKVAAAEVRLESGEQIVVPLANLEVLE